MKKTPFFFLFLILAQVLAVGCDKDGECKALPRSHFEPPGGEAESPENYDY